MLKCKVKIKSAINKTVAKVEEDGQNKLHTEGVLYVDTILDELRKMEFVEIVSTYVYGNLYAFGVKKADGGTTFISPKWVKDVTDGTLTIAEPTNDIPTNSTYITQGKVLLHKDNITLVHTDDLKLCTCCGSPIEEDTVLNKAKLCKRCYVDRHFDVKSYSHKPKPIFVGEQLENDADTPVWYGVELEYGLNSKLSICKAIAEHNIYLKSDNSIESGTEGRAEMVTHPYSFKHLMGEDSWINNIDSIDANSSIKNGCHIHVSRTAWKDNKHFALTYYLMYEMGAKNGAEKSMLEILGGRTFTNYCKRDRPSDKIHKITKDGAKSNGRIWLNESNEKTIEFRFFGGTNKAVEMKRYVQLLEAVIKYTKYHSKRVTITGLGKYIEKHKVKYKELHKFWEANNFQAEATIVYKAPVRKSYLASNVKYSVIMDTVLIEMQNGTVYDNVTGIHVDGSTLYFRKANRDSMSVQFDDVKRVEVEV